MEVEPQQASGVPDGWEVVSAPPAPTPPSDARPSVSARAGVPAAGRGSQINPDQSMRGLELATTPLARPTGIDAVDGLLSPAGLASLAAGGYGIARAGVAGGLAAGAKEAVATAAPALKYEAAKTLLEKMGVPSPLAVTVAIAVSGYKKGAKPAASSAAPENVIPFKRPPVAPEAVPPTIGEAAETTAAPAAAVPAPAAPVAAAPTNALPNQKLLNELAIQARRAGVKLTPETEQAAIAAVTKGATPADAVKAVATPTAAAPAAAAEAAPVWTPTKMRLTADEAKVAAKLIQQGLTADEAKVAAKLIQQGKTDQEVQQAIEAARAFRQRFGTPTPTAAQTRFGKGTR